MASRAALVAALYAAAVKAQAVCTLTKETHPPLVWEKCSEGGTCEAVAASVVIDSNWRWTHSVSGSDNCYTGNSWNSTFCPDSKTCATKCCVDGADYSSTYGITTSGSSLSLKFVTKGPYSTNVGSRTYLMNGEDKYQMFNLMDSEFTFDVDVSNLPCGLNGALYFVSMAEDGGMSQYPTNKVRCMQTYWGCRKALHTEHRLTV